MNLHDEIARIAYELYEKSGKVNERDFENWLEAEKIVMAMQNNKGKLLVKAAGNGGKVTAMIPKSQKSKKQFHTSQRV